MTGIDIEALEATAEQLRKVALKATESYMLIEEAIMVLKGETNATKDETRHEADAAVQAGGKAVRTKGDGSLPHKGLSVRMDAVRGSGSSVSPIHEGPEPAEEYNPTVTVVFQKPKPLGIPVKDRQRVCEVCGKPFTWGESGFKLCCSKECNNKRLSQRQKERRMKNNKDIFKAPEYKADKLDKKVKALAEQGTTYADKQKADTIEKFARIDLGGKS